MTPVPLWRRYARFFGPDPVADVKDELRFHLDAKADDLIAQLNEQEEQRYQKLLRLRERGEEPYPLRAARTHTAQAATVGNSAIIEWRKVPFIAW